VNAYGDGDLPPNAFDEDGSFNPDFRLRPDILDLNAGREQIYEVKSQAEAWKGPPAVTKYLAVLAVRYPGRSFKRGMWDPAGQLFYIKVAYGLPMPMRIQAWRSAPGVIAWRSMADEDIALGAFIATEITYALLQRGAGWYARLTVTWQGARLPKQVSLVTLTGMVSGIAI